MNSTQLFHFLIGLMAALTLGSIIWVVVGTRLRLYLVGQDSMIRDQSVIAITAELKKGSTLHSLRNGTWREDVDLTLRDYDERAYQFEIGFSLWLRFFLILRGNGGGEARLRGRRLEINRKHYIRTGDSLRIGDRDFRVLVTPTIIGDGIDTDPSERSRRAFL